MPGGLRAAEALCRGAAQRSGRGEAAGGAQSGLHLPPRISRVTHNAYFTFYKTKEMKGNISVTEEDIRPLIAEMMDIFRWRSSLTCLH